MVVVGGGIVRVLGEVPLQHIQHALSLTAGMQRVKACPLAVSCCPQSAVLVFTVLSTVPQRS